jgi:Chain length determinant protein
MFEVPRQIQSAAAGSANVAVDFPANTGIDVRRILAVLWRGKATLLWTTAASLLIAVMFVLIVPHRYTATTQILIDPTDLHAVGNELTPTNQANDATVLQVESQVRVLTSDSVLQRVVKAEALDKDAEFAGQAAGDQIARLVGSRHRARRHRQRIAGPDHRARRYRCSARTRFPARRLRCRAAFGDRHLGHYRPLYMDADVEQAGRRIDQSSAAIRRILSTEAAMVRDRLFLPEERLAFVSQRLLPMAWNSALGSPN